MVRKVVVEWKRRRSIDPVELHLLDSLLSVHQGAVFQAGRRLFIGTFW